MSIGQSSGVSQAFSFLSANSAKAGSTSTDGFRAAMRQAYTEGGMARSSSNPVINNPLGPGAWPDRFSGRLEAAAEELGISVDEVKEKFAAITQRAIDEDGFADPKGFLSALSDEERETVRAVQGIWKTLDSNHIEGLDHEGALNLLLPPGAQRDVNNDGFYQIGEGLVFRFPPDNASPAMREAWDAFTADMPESDLLMAEGRFLPLLLVDNIKMNGEGKPIGVYEPGDPEFHNPLADPDFSYLGHAREKLAYILENPGMMSRGQFERDRDFWSGLIDKMQQFGVA